MRRLKFLPLLFAAFYMLAAFQIGWEGRFVAAIVVWIAATVLAAEGLGLGLKEKS